MFPIIIRPLAENDIKEASIWYNKTRGGLGDEFLLAVEAKLYQIRRNPKGYQSIYKAVRRVLTDRFPYGIFYIVEQDKIYNLAVVHTSRNPKHWITRYEA